MFAAAGPLLHPGAGQAAQDVAVGKQGHITIDCEQLIDQPLATGGDRSGILPAGAAMAPHTPIRHGLPDLFGGDAFVIAVIPLAQVLVHLCAGAQASQLAGAPGPLQWTHPHLREGLTTQPWSQGLGFLFPIRQQGDVAAAGVAAIAAPFGGAVAEQPDGLARGHGRAPGLRFC